MAHAYERNLPAELPSEANRWNWGAFLLTWVWGIGNSTFISLLVFVPVLGILIMPFVLGANGNAWAWRNRSWDSVEHFRRVQRLWGIWGAVIWVGLIVLVSTLFFFVFYELSHSEAYNLAGAKLRASSEVVNALGTPISTGFPSGSIKLNGDSGSATMTFSAKGPKGSGEALLDAVKKGGVWSIQRLQFTVDGSDEIIDIVNPTSAELAPAAAARPG